jgi:hypothetical protein
MGPTVFRARGYRFFFFSREESRKHVHVVSGDGEAKFWLEPGIELARHHGYDGRHLKEIRTLIEDRYDDIFDAWQRHFGR